MRGASVPSDGAAVFCRFGEAAPVAAVVDGGGSDGASVVVRCTAPPLAAAAPRAEPRTLQDSELRVPLMVSGNGASGSYAPSRLQFLYLKEWIAEQSSPDSHRQGVIG